MKNVFIALTALVTALVTGLTLTAHAEQKNYGSGGCGLGSMIMGKDGNQIIAMTTNNSLGTQTFAISSGTSNCVDSGVVKRKKQVRAFIEINKLQLASDIAKGSGETIESLAELLNCNDDHALASGLQRRFDLIFPSPKTSADHVERAIHHMIATELATSCVG